MFLLQVVYPDGTPVKFLAGEKVEMDLRAALRSAVLERSRFFGHLAPEHVDDAIAEVFERFKAKAIPGQVA